MRGTVFAKSNAIVRKDKGRWIMRQRRKTNRRAHIICKDKERSAVGNHTAKNSHAINNRTHRMFSHAKMEVPSFIRIFLEGRASVNFCIVRGSQIRRTADQLREFYCN